MKPTTHNTRQLFAHLRTATALTGVLGRDLGGGENRHGFDMRVGPAADLLDAIGREVGAVASEAEGFESVSAEPDAWPAAMPEAMLFRSMEPVPVLPEATVRIQAERIDGVLTVTAATLRQGEVYVHPSAVVGALDEVAGMPATIAAVLDRVAIDDAPPTGSADKPGMGPSKAWSGESAA